MTNKKFTEVGLFLATLLSGFYAGTGFFVAIGGNPAIKLMSDRTFAEYWQHTDHFMAARMKIFGPILLISFLFALLCLYKKYHRKSFGLMLIALGILVTDMIFIFSTNHPLNHIVQSWNVNQLPGNVSDIKWQIVKAFNVRTFFMIGSFVMVLLAAGFYKKQPA